MSIEMRDQAAAAIQLAKKAGAQGASAQVSANRQVQVAYRDRKPETIKEASTRELLLRVYVDGRYSGQTTSDLRPAALQKFVADAVAMTKLLAPDPFRTLPDPKYFAGRATADLGLVDSGYAAFTPAERHRTVKAIEEACLARGGDKVVAVQARVNDARSEEVLLTSNGFEGTAASTYYVAVAQMTAQDAGDRRPAGYAYAVSVDRAGMPAPEKVGVEAADRTLSVLGGRKIKTETLPVVIENRCAANVLGVLLEAMDGRSVQQKQSFLADKKGQRIGSPLLTLVDDPLLPKGLGSRTFDGDGLTARRRTMIDTGVLKELYVGWYYSRKLGCEPTTAQTSNLILPPGTRTPAAIMKELGRGIFITDFIGGNSNSTTGDSSVGIIGHLFENGALVHPVAEMNIADNAVAFFSKLVEVGNDPFPYSSQRIPSLVFKDVVVSGV